MATEFTKGDKVICRDNEDFGDELPRGRMFTVSEYSASGEFLRLDETDTVWWSPHRFVLAQATSPATIVFRTITKQQASADGGVTWVDVPAVTT